MAFLTRSRGAGGGLNDPTSPNQLAQDTASGVDGNKIAAIVSAIALLFSAWSLWDTSLKKPELRVFVAPVVHYSSPYQNSNFEVLAVPVTVTNEGARTGTVLSMELAVTDPRTNETKRFYAADLGRWTMEKTRAGAYQPFAPISLAGRTSRTESVLFYPRGEAEKPQQVIRDKGTYKMTLTLELAEADDFGFLDRLWPSPPPVVTFERNLPFYDARSFQNGTIFMTSPDWKSSTGSAAR